MASREALLNGSPTHERVSLFATETLFVRATAFFETL